MASALLPRDMQKYLWIWAHHQKSQIKRYSLRHKDNKSIWLYFHDPGLCIHRSVHSKHLAHQLSIHIKNKLQLTFHIIFYFIGDNSTSVIWILQNVPIFEEDKGVELDWSTTRHLRIAMPVI
jgi:hypothetical protein